MTLQIECTLCEPIIIFTNGQEAERHLLNEHAWNDRLLRIKK